MKTVSFFWKNLQAEAQHVLSSWSAKPCPRVRTSFSIVVYDAVLENSNFRPRDLKSNGQESFSSNSQLVKSWPHLIKQAKSLTTAGISYYKPDQTNACLKSHTAFANFSINKSSAWFELRNDRLSYLFSRQQFLLKTHVTRNQNISNHSSGPNYWKSKWVESARFPWWLSNKSNKIRSFPVRFLPNCSPKQRILQRTQLGTHYPGSTVVWSPDIQMKHQF